MTNPIEDCIKHRMKDWLPAQSPAVWHEIATCWNWGSGIEPLAWIASQPSCDAGTAQTIFWNGEPSEYSVMEQGRNEVSAYRHDVYDMLAQIAARWNAGEYITWRYKTIPDILTSRRFYDLPAANSDFDVDPSIMENGGQVEFDNVDIRLIEGQPLDIIKTCYGEQGKDVPKWMLG